MSINFASLPVEGKIVCNYLGAMDMLRGELAFYPVKYIINIDPFVWK